MSERNIKVVHYGPTLVTDPDHSTAISIVDETDEISGSNGDDRLENIEAMFGSFLTLNSDEEVRELVHQLSTRLWDENPQFLEQPLPMPPDRYIEEGSRGTGIVVLKKTFKDVAATNTSFNLSITVGELKAMLAEAAKSGYRNAWGDAAQTATALKLQRPTEVQDA
jgi:hypothetical protein